jgi:hypothetical protein
VQMLRGYVHGVKQGKGKRECILPRKPTVTFSKISQFKPFLVKHSLQPPKVSRLSLSLSLFICPCEITTKRTSVLSQRQINPHGPLNWLIPSLHLLIIFNFLENIYKNGL